MIPSISISAIPSFFNFASRVFWNPFSQKIPSQKCGGSLTGKKIIPLPTAFARINNLSPEKLNNSWSIYLKEVSEEILNHSDLRSHPDLKKVLNSLESKNLELFFEKLASAEIEKPSVSAVEETLKLIDIHQMEACLKTKNPFFKDAKAWASEFHTVEKKQVSPMIAATGNTQNVVTRFFPNLFHIFLKAFNLFDSEKPPATLYEYGVLATMYFQFFSLAYFLIKGLSSLMGPIHTMLTSTLILGLTVGAIYAYFRWIKKCPKQVIFCENISDKHRQGKLHPVIGREEEFRQALACLNDTQKGTTVNLLIVGEPGVGKSEFLNGLAQRISNREVFWFKTWSLFGAPNAFQSPGEKVEEAFREVRGFEQKVIFLCPELGDAKELTTFLKPVLSNESIQFVGEMTRQQYEDLKKERYSFRKTF